MISARDTWLGLATWLPLLSWQLKGSMGSCPAGNWLTLEFALVFALNANKAEIKRIYGLSFTTASSLFVLTLICGVPNSPSWREKGKKWPIGFLIQVCLVKIPTVTWTATKGENNKLVVCDDDGDAGAMKAQLLANCRGEALLPPLNGKIGLNK